MVFILEDLLGGTVALLGAVGVSVGVVYASFASIVKTYDDYMRRKIPDYRVPKNVLEV
jgi:hypothetical protein